MKNYTTPRTLADASFRTDYPIHARSPSRITIGGVLLSTAIGVTLALLLIHWLAR